MTSAQPEREFQRTQQTIEQLNIDPKALENAMTPADVIVEVTSFASGNAEVKSTIEKAADRIRYPRDEAGDLLANVHGTMDALRELLKVPKNLAGSTIWVLLGLGAILAGLTYKALAYVGGVALISWATWIAAAARAAARFVADARKREQEIVEARKTRLKTELDRQALALKNAKDDEASKEQTLTAARAQSLAVQPELRMTNFVRERLAAWQKDAGVIAAAHRDFRELSRFLQRVVSTPAVADGKPAPVPIDRIVLYIDDLDRCPEDKVFQVLQAVHLLLAFDLFVVIVAVDSSWLLESVKTFSKRTPQNYLEKIFQIPYTLDPMPVERFGDFVKSLTSTLATPERSEAATPKLVIDGAPPGSIPESRLVNTPADATKPDETIRLEAAKSNEPPVDPAPEHLTFEEHEVNFTTALFPFMSSPRNTKRFVNVYRLLRATLEPAELAAFRDGKTGAHLPAQFLIAVITNQHEIAPKFCADLRAAKPNSTWETFSNSFFAEDTPHGRAIRKMHEADRMLAGRKIKDFQDWLPRVARYSFEMGRLMTDSA